MLLLEFGPKSDGATLVFLQIGPYCRQAKACEKRQAQLLCCSKFASSETSQLSFCSKLGRIVRKLQPVGDCVRNCPVKNLTLVQNTVRNSPVNHNLRQNTLRNCRFAWNGPVLLGNQNLWKTPCTTFLLLEIASNHTAQLSFFLEGKAWGKHRVLFSCCSKLASKHSAQLSFCFELASLVKQPDKIFSLFYL